MRCCLSVKIFRAADIGGRGYRVGLELPQSVEMEITETSPSIKGASASARTKPAEFATGLSIQVPEYLSAGEKVKINTQDKRFMGRAD